jgi:bacillithiol biosynthesis cysteine-adding enzyme BshC
MEPSFDHIPKIIEVDATATDFYKPIVNQYIAETDFPNELVSTTSYSEMIDQMNFDEDYRNALADELLRQYRQSNIELNEASPVYKNIESLRKSSTFTVTTGQQIHIFLGPLFVINKILSCCAEARKISEELPDNDVVPVFWMASEDHDFDEIKSVKLYNETYTWDIESNGPVGRLNPKSLLPLVEQAQARIDQKEENLHFLNICKEAYGSCGTFAEATRYILHEMYEDLGILIADADADVLKHRLIENIEADLYDHQNSKHIDESIKVLKQYKIKPPINTRPINYFLLHDNGRYRIVKSDTGFELVGHSDTWTDAEMKELIRSNPKKFSPNALVRPIYQQCCLPNLVYLCGGSEFIYWLELKKAVNASKSVFPRLILRKSNFIISGKNEALVKQLNLTLDSLFLKQEKFDQIFVTKTNTLKENLDKKIREYSDEIDALIDQLIRDGKSPLTKVVKAKNQLFNQVRQEFNRIYISDIRSNPDYNRINKTKNKIWSEQFVQERNTSILGALSHGIAMLKVFKNDYNQYTGQRNLLITIL